MITIRTSNSRGHVDHGWLDARHTFSFGDYHDRNHMSFRALRVINEDRVAPGQGFGAHPHRDMEIITYIVHGALQHQDAIGDGGHTAILRPGEVQRISAGSGIMHSEVNPSKSEPVHLLQIWLTPWKRGLEPRYDQVEFPAADRRNRLLPVVAPDGATGSSGAIPIYQDARVFASLLDQGKSLTHHLAPGRGAWLQLIRGGLTLNGQPLSAGDGAAVENETNLTIAATADAEFLLFDLV